MARLGRAALSGSLEYVVCSTDRLCRCGAAVENLAHSASLHSLENNAPSNPGIKHLADRAERVLAGVGFRQWLAECVAALALTACPAQSDHSPPARRPVVPR